jgi:hypothetical protein
MFHPTQIEDVEERIKNDLLAIDYHFSVKLYLCWYDEFLVEKGTYNGMYPCSEETVRLHDVITIIKKVFKQPCIIRHNILHEGALPIALNEQAELQSDIEKYVEVCLIH